MDNNEIVPPPPPPTRVKQSSSSSASQGDNGNNNEPWGELVIVNRDKHPDIPQRISLRKNKIEVGRHLKNSAIVDIRLHTNNRRRFISRKHAVFRRLIISGTPRYDLIDQKSMCCTFVNGTKITPVYKNLQTGDEIRFGGGNRTILNETKVVQTSTLEQDSLLFRFRALEDTVSGKKRKRTVQKKKKKKKKKKSTTTSQKKKKKNEKLKNMGNIRDFMSKKKQTTSPQSSSSLDSQSTPMFRVPNREEENNNNYEPFEKKRKLNDDDMSDEEEEEVSEEEEDVLMMTTTGNKVKKIEHDHQQKLKAMKDSYDAQKMQEFALLDASEKELEKDSLFSLDIINDLRCGICRDFIRNSMMLPCSHNFCKRCLIDYMILASSTSSSSSSNTIHDKTCPTCSDAILARPIRNRTLDALVESFVPYMSSKDREEFQSREEREREKDEVTITKFRGLVRKSKNKGKSLFNINEKWNTKKKGMVRNHLTTKFKSGRPREAYFECIGFDRRFLQKAGLKALRVASDNLGIARNAKDSSNNKERCDSCVRKLKKDQKIKNLRDVLQKFHDSEYFGL